MPSATLLAARLERLGVNDEDDSGTVLGSCMHGVFVLSTSGSRVHMIPHAGTIPWAGEAWPPRIDRLHMPPSPPSGHHRISQIDKALVGGLQGRRATAGSKRFAGAELPLLNDDSTHLVLALLDEVSLVHASCVCRGWYNLAVDGTLWKHFFMHRVQGLIASAAACAALAHTGKLPTENVALFIQAAELTDLTGFGPMLRHLYEQRPEINWMNVLDVLSARKGLIVARLLGFLRVFFCPQHSRPPHLDDYRLYTKLLFRLPLRSDPMEDVAPFALVARAIAFSEMYLNHAMMSDLRKLVGVEGVAGMTFIYAKLGSDAARPLRTSPVDVYPIQLYVFAQHKECFGDPVAMACGILRCCSMRNILRHGQFVDIARNLLSKLYEKVNRHATGSTSGEAGDREMQNEEAAFAFDFCDYSDHAPDDVRDLVHATANKNWPSQLWHPVGWGITLLQGRDID